MKNKSVPRRSRLRRVELLLLPLLIGTAGWLWSGPWRAERTLRSASFHKLLIESKRDRDNPRVFYWLGVRLRELGHLGPARAAFSRASELDPEDEQTALDWGATAAAFGQTQEAYAALSRAVQKHPDSARAHQTMALFCHENYALQKAYDEARAAAKCDPKSAVAWRLTGVCAYELQYYPESEQALRTAAALDAGEWRTRLALAQTLNALHRADAAIGMLQEASRLAPDQPTVTLALGQALLAHANTPATFSAARNTLARAVARGASGPALVALGTADARLERWSEARSELEQAQQQLPNSADVHFELARVLRRLGDTVAAQTETRLHDALKAYDEQKLSLGAQARVSKDPAVRLKLARLLTAHGEIAAAAAEYRGLIASPHAPPEVAPELAALEKAHPELAASSPVTPAAPVTAGAVETPLPDLLRDAEAMRHHNRLPEAERAYLAILDRKPDYAPALQGLGLDLVAQGKTKDAFKALDKAAQLDPQLDDAQFALAKLYYDQAFTDEAARRMEALITRAPKNAAYLHALAVCYLNDPAHSVRTEQLMRDAVALEPNNAVYLRDLARAEAVVNKFKEAEADYRRSLNLSPEDANLLVLSATFLLDHEGAATHRREAEQLLRHAIEIEPQNVDALTGLGRIALVKHDVKGAIEYLEAALKSDPNQQTAWMHLARAFELSGDRARAADCRNSFKQIANYRNDLSNTEEQAQIDLKNPTLRLKLARLYSAGGQNARAINQYRVYLSMRKDDKTAARELDYFIRHLQSAGRLPSMDELNSMLLASSKPK